MSAEQGRDGWNVLDFALLESGVGLNLQSTAGAGDLTEGFSIQASVDWTAPWLVPLDSDVSHSAMAGAATLSQPLEAPSLPPGYSIYWAVDKDGSWSTKADWSGDRLPGSSDNVGINTTDLHTVTFSSGTSTVNSLTVGNDDLVVSGGSLTVSSGASFANSLTVSAGTLTLDGSVSIDQLTQTGGTLNIGGTLSAGEVTLDGGSTTILALGSNNATVSGLFTQTGGTVSGTGTLTLAGGADLTSSGGSAELMTGSGKTILQGTSTSVYDYLYLDGGRTLENQGTLTMSGTAGESAAIALGQNPFGGTIGGATLQNDAGATLNFDFTNTAGTYNGIFVGLAGTDTFTNAGLVENTGNGAGSQETQILATFTNTGTLAIDAGELALNAGGSSSGTITVASGGLLDIDGSSSSTFTLSGGTISGAGMIELDSGTLRVTAPMTIGTALTIDGSSTTTLSLGGNNVTVSGLFTQTAGTVSGAGTLTLAGGAAFSTSGGDELMTGSGKTVLQGTSTMSGYNYFYLDGGRTLENQGTLTLTATGEDDSTYIELGHNPFGTTVGGATLQNDAGATIDFDYTNAAYTENGVFAGTGTLAFTNAGLVENTGSATGSYETQIDVAFTNTGTLAINSGELALNDGGSSSGTITVASGALLDFHASGTTAFTISNAQTFSGSVELDGGVLNTGALAIGQNLTIDGGTYNANGALSIGQNLSISDGTLNAGGTFSLGGALTIDGSSTTTLSLGGDNVTVSGLFSNSSGDATISGTGTLTLAGGATFSSDGYDLMTGSGKTILQGNSTLSNDTYICLDGGRTLENQGTVTETQGGEILLGYNPFGSSLGGGTLQNDAGATVDFDNTNSDEYYGVSVYANAGATSFTNAGLVENTGNGTGNHTTSIEAAFTNTGTVAVNAGEFALDDGGSSSGTITVASGALLDFDASGSTAFAISNAQTFSGSVELDGGVLNTAALTIGQNLTIDGGTYNAGGATTVDGTLTITSGTLAVAANTSFSADGGGSASTSSFTLASGSTLDFDSSSSANFTLSGGGTIGASGTTVQLDGGTLSVSAATTFGGALTLDGGTLAIGNHSDKITGIFTDDGNNTVSGTGTLTANGSASFTGSTELMSGTGTTVLKSTTSLSSGDVLCLDGGWTLENNGTLTETGGSGIVLGKNPFGTSAGGGTLDNISGATINFDNTSFDNAVQVNTGTTSFTNAGLVENTGTGETAISASFTNTGTVSITAGELAFDGGGSSAASAIAISSGAILDFDASGSTTFTLSGGGTIGSSGSAVEVDGGTLSVTSATTFGGGLTVTGGTLSLGANNAGVTGQLDETGGTISGTGTLTASGGASFGGTAELMTGSGTTLLDSTSGISADDRLYLDGGRVLENQGTLTLGDDSGIVLGENPFGTSLGGGTLENLSGATLDFDFTVYAGGVYANTGTTSFTNAGLLETTGNAAAVIDAAFTNTGTIAVDAGELILQGGGSSSASAITIASGTTLDVAGGTFTLSGGTIGGAGSVQINSGTLDVTAGTTFGGQLNIDGGTLSLNSGTDIVDGALNNSGGAIALNAGQLDLDGGGSSAVSGFTLASGTTLDFDASGSTTFTLTGNGTLGSSGAAIELAGGILDVTGEATFDSTLTVSGGSLALGSGAELSLADGGSSAASAITVGSDAILDFDGGTFTLSGGTIGGTGAVELDSGALSVTSSTTFGGAVNVDGGTLSLNGGTDTIAGALHNSGGTVALNAGELILQGGGSSSVSGITLASGTTLDFDGGTFSLSGGGTLGGNGATVELAGGTLNVTGATTFGGAVNVTGGTLALNGGTDIVDGALTDSGGTIALNAGELVLDGGGSSSVGGFSLTTGTTLDFNGGTFTLSGTGTLGNSGVTIDVSGGTLDVTGDAALGGALDVAGGSLALSSGAELSLDDGGSSSASAIAIASGATLDFHGGTFALSGGTIGGTGTVEVDSGTLSLTGATAFGGAVNVDGGSLQLVGGTVVVDGAFDNSGGAVSLNAGELSLDGGGSSAVSGFSLASGTTLDFGGGTFMLSGGGTLGGTGTAVELDSGTLDITGATTFGGALNVTGGVLEFGAGTSQVVGLFTNNGGVVVQSGQLDVNGGMTGTGTVTVDSGTTFQLNASATTAANYVDIAAGTGLVDLTGGSGNDMFQFGGNFQASDVINGNGGDNTLILDGDYSDGLTFGKTTMVNVENITLDNGYSYDLTLNKATVATGQTLTVDASSLGAGDTLTFTGTKAPGNLVVYGASGGHDTILFGKGGNVFVGDGGEDSISCKKGTDIVVYNQASDSTSTGFDTVSSFKAATDQFSVFSQVTNIDAKYHGGTLDASNFDADLTSDLAGRLTAGGAILYEAKSGSYAGTEFLVIDQNGVAGYQAGQDLVIEVPRFSGTLSTSDFLLDYAPGAPETENHTHGSHTAGHAHGTNLPESFDWDAIFANSGHQSARPHIANPFVAGAEHQTGFAGGHHAADDLHAFGHSDAFYHSQLDALWFDGGHGALTEQFSLPHAEYFGS
ncbi:MAG TPA: hypothetical protein VHX61_08635 [Rhizomicrobium sp.]|nr:hypothetical protein [Rhizomicrobium sp.]